MEKWAIHLVKKKLKYPIIIAIMFFDCGVSYSQNLLPNPSFEDENICTELRMACAPAGWSSVNMSDSYIYTNEPIAHNGSRASGVTTFNSNLSHPLQYIEAPILCPLIKDKVYTFSVYLKSNRNEFGSLGIYFSDKYLCTVVNSEQPYFKGLAYSPQLKLKATGRKNITKEWTKEEWKFIATGNERYIVIGNFLIKSDLKRKAPKHYNQDENRAIIYIDDVSLTPEDSRCDCNYTAYLKEIYSKYSRRHSCEEELPSDSFVKVYGKVDLTPDKPIVLKDINFNSASADLLPSSNDMLDSIVSFLKHNKKLKLEISGHTDNEGSDEYNMTLSENRANSVMTYLILHGIEAERLTAVGYGNTKPIASNANNAGKAINRRVEIKILRE